MMMIPLIILRASITQFCHVLHNDHGALSHHPETGQLMYGFIHGNWTLDNSGHDGKLCGVNDELIVLKETGCYADFTYPSAPHGRSLKPLIVFITLRMILLKPKSHNTGVDVAVGGSPWGDL